MAQDPGIKSFELLLVGGSAGSLDPVLYLLPALKKETQLAIVLVLHRSGGESVLCHLLSQRTSWPVKEAEEKDSIEPGTIYIAPADYHLLVESDKTFSLDTSEKVNYSRPSIDVTFESAAEIYGEALIALLLSGANNDGTNGLKMVKQQGGYTIVQQPAEAIVPFMPQNAIDNVPIDSVVSTLNAPSLIRSLLLNG